MATLKMAKELVTETRRAEAEVHLLPTRAAANVNGGGLRFGKLSEGCGCRERWEVDPEFVSQLLLFPQIE